MDREREQQAFLQLALLRNTPGTVIRLVDGADAAQNLCIAGPLHMCADN